MADFEIKTDGIKTAVRQERKMADRILSLCRELANCKNSLDISVSHEYMSVKQKISSLNDQLLEMSGRIGNMADTLEQISGIYESTEKEIWGHFVNHEKIADVKNGTVTMETAASGGLSALSKLIKALNDQKDNPNAKFLSSLLAAISSGMGLSESENLADWFQKFIGFSGSTIGLGSKFGKSLEAMINKCGTPAAKKWMQENSSAFSADMKGMGAIGSAVGFASKFYGAIQDSDSFAAFLKNSGGWISSGGDLVGTLNEMKKEDVKGTVHPIVSMLNMAGYAAGDIIDLSTDGHPLTANEIADLCMGTGLTGVKSCVSQITFGLVDIDTERSKGIFNKNIAWTTERITTWNIPTGAQAALGFVATPFVAAYSMGETFFDMGYQIGNGIMSWFAS